MKRLMVFLIVLVLSNFSLAYSVKEEYKEARREQYYRHALQRKEVTHQGEMRVIRARYDQKVRKRRRIPHARRRGYYSNRGGAYRRSSTRYASFSSYSGSYIRVFQY